MKDYALKKPIDTIIYIGGDNASDTLDLWGGRGLSAEKPFATFFGCVEWLRSTYTTNGIIHVRIQSDLTLSATYPWFLVSLMNCVHFSSYPIGTKKTLTCPKTLKFFSGTCYFENLIFNATDPVENQLFQVNGNYRGSHPTLKLTNCELNGSTGNNGTVVVAMDNATVFASGLTGNIQGKRYTGVRGSKIFGTIPGTSDGTADASSYVG